VYQSFSCKSPIRVTTGFVTSLAHPGGNITGFTSFEYAMGGRWLELLKEIVPSVTQVAVILQRENPTNAGTFHQISVVAASMGLPLISAGVRDTSDIELALETFARKSNGGLIVIANPIATSNSCR